MRKHIESHGTKEESRTDAKKEVVTPDCSGFLLIHKTDAAGKVIGIEIREVVIRKDRTFFRYKKGDAKSRNRAKNKAKTAADDETITSGLKQFSLFELPGRNVKDVLPIIEQSLSPPSTMGNKILYKLGNIHDLLWEDRRARQSEDMMCQSEIELLLEGVRLGQKMQSQTGMK